MKEEQIKENKKLCLEQLRLSKWQLIWNREHEIRMFEEQDKREMTRLELEGKTDTKAIVQMGAAIDSQIKAKKGEIEYAKKEIEFLNKDIEAFK